jgi:arsenate reductase
VIDGHDDDHETAQHVDGREAVGALVGDLVHEALRTSCWPRILKLSPRLGNRHVMRITIYGIRNCDTMKKARAWLDSHGVAHDFHDYKTEGIDRATLEKWMAAVGWEVLLNRAGTTFRKLPDPAKIGLNRTRATELMLEQPSMIKRPVLERGKTLIVGFAPERYAELV